MTFSPEQTEQLQAKLSVEHVKTRKQAGRTLSYLEGWVAIAEANRIFGHDGWTRETVSCEEACRYEYTIGEGGQNPRNGWKVGYVAKVRVTAGGISREGTGHGNGISTDLYDAIESAAKEAETDAMKRALMTFGNPFGLALYDKDQRNVERKGGGYGAQADQRVADSVKKFENKSNGPCLIPVQDIENQVERWKRWRDEFQTVITNSKSPEECDQWWEANAAPLTNLKLAYDKTYDKLHNFVEERKERLLQEAGFPTDRELSPLDAG